MILPEYICALEEYHGTCRCGILVFFTRQIPPFVSPHSRGGFVLPLLQLARASSSKRGRRHHHSPRIVCAPIHRLGVRPCFPTPTYSPSASTSTLTPLLLPTTLRITRNNEWYVLYPPLPHNPLCPHQHPGILIFDPLSLFCPPAPRGIQVSLSSWPSSYCLCPPSAGRGGCPT